ncbi:MAG: hypothetical protein V4489_07285, partial [Chlamydiota bacterium]
MNERNVDTITHALFSPIAEVLATQKADALSSTNHLHSSKEAQYIKEQTEELTQDLQKEYTNFVGCMKKASVVLQQELKHLPSKEQEHHQKEFNLAASKLNAPQEDLELTLKEFATASSWQQFLGFSDKTLLWVYQIARQCYEKKNLEESLSLFQFLININTFVSDYWTAIGFVRRALHQTSEALDCFAMAILLNQDNPIPRVQSAELYYEIGQFSDTVIELEIAKNLIVKNKLDFPIHDIEDLLTK